MPQPCWPPRRATRARWRA